MQWSFLILNQYDSLWTQTRSTSFSFHWYLDTLLFLFDMNSRYGQIRIGINCIISLNTFLLLFARSSLLFGYFDYLGWTLLDDGFAFRPWLSQWFHFEWSLWLDSQWWILLHDFDLSYFFNESLPQMHWSQLVLMTYDMRVVSFFDRSRW